ncbi:MAG: hypothetical protein V3V08_07730 [Nannocystaceae bacterium]
MISVGSSCYTAELNGSASGVFLCAENSECSEEHVCVLGYCTSNKGPQLRIVGPEPLTRYAVAEPVTLPIVLLGDDLVLDEPRPERVDGHGYLAIRIDDTQVGEPITSGDLHTGVSLELALGQLDPGIHRIEVWAYESDGKRYPNPSATAASAVWVDDGAPHVAILRPLPGSKHRASDPMDVEVVTLNFQFVDPGFSAADFIDGEGHTHVYAGLDYPGCLPGCNFSYAVGGSIKPEGEDPTTTVTGQLEPLDLGPGTLTLTASLNYTGHLAVPFKSADDWSNLALYDGLVNDTIRIELLGALP